MVDGLRSWADSPPRAGGFLNGITEGRGGRRRVRVGTGGFGGPARQGGRTWIWQWDGRSCRIVPAYRGKGDTTQTRPSCRPIVARQPDSEHNPPRPARAVGACRIIVARRRSSDTPAIAPPANAGTERHEAQARLPHRGCSQAPALPAALTPTPGARASPVAPPPSPNPVGNVRDLRLRVVSPEPPGASRVARSVIRNGASGPAPLQDAGNRAAAPVCAPARTRH
jgi:hypothetical protein